MKKDLTQRPQKLEYINNRPMYTHKNKQINSKNIFFLLIILVKKKTSKEIDNFMDHTILPILRMTFVLRFQFYKPHLMFVYYLPYTNVGWSFYGSFSVLFKALKWMKAPFWNVSLLKSKDINFLRKLIWGT